jgi:hypothetical protein
MAALQIVRFRTNPDVAEADIVAINERFQREIAPILPGLERREAVRSAAGDWILVLRYVDMEAATAPPGDHGMDVAGALFSMIDMSTMSTEFFTIVSE